MPLVTAVAADGGVAVAWSLAADRTAVWARLVDTASMPAWLGQPVVAELQPGGRLTVDHGGGYLCRSTVHEVAAGSALTLSWCFPDEPETRVTFELTDGPAGGRRVPGCQLQLNHAGLGELAGSYRLGWVVHLMYFEAVVHETPIPIGQFWNLHATLQAFGPRGAVDQ